MGCTSSKSFHIQAGVQGRDLPREEISSQNCAHSANTPIYYPKSPEQCPFYVVALTSSSSGALCMGLENFAPAKDAISSHYNAELKHEQRHSSSSSKSRQLHDVKMSEIQPLKPIEKSNTIDVKDLVKDLEQDESYSRTKGTRQKTTKAYGRTFTLPKARKNRNLDGQACTVVDLSEDNIPFPKPATSIHVEKEIQTKHASLSVLSSRKSIEGLFYGASLFSIEELEPRDVIADLHHQKLLAFSGHANEKSKGVATVYISTPSAYLESCNFDLQIPNSFGKATTRENELGKPDSCGLMLTSQSTCRLGSLCINKVFEKAITRENDECNGATSQRDNEASLNMEISPMDKCLFLESKDEHVTGGTVSNNSEIRMTSEVIKKASTHKKFSCSKVSAIEIEEKKLDVTGLENYKLKCPPGGQDRVVLYFTSLRGIRKTYEDCNNARRMLQHFIIKIDERDISMHVDFQKELKHLLDKPVQVPMIFIKGRHIGGIEELLQLNEHGALVKLLEGLPREKAGYTCGGCGGARFIPCLKCSGSCKLLSDMKERIRCPDCNENGLLRCPICF